MGNENNQERIINPNAFERALSYLTDNAKAFPILIGLTYLVGYLANSFQLAIYGLPANQLLDAQYFAAGLIIGPFLGSVALVIISAYNYDPNSDADNRKPRWVRYGLIFWSMSIGYFFAVIAVASILPTLSPWLLSLSIPIWFVIVGYLGIWLFVVALRRRLYLFGDLMEKRIREDRPPVFFPTLYRAALRLPYLLFTIFYSSLALVSLLLFLVGFYGNLPQAYGGARPLQVRLYVDPSRVPTDLLVSLDPLDQDSVGETVPLMLIFRSRNEYIVRQVDDSEQRVWVLDNDAVYGFVSLEKNFLVAWRDSLNDLIERINEQSESQKDNTH